MNTIRTVLREVRHHLRVFRRVPVAAFFTVAFPMMFLLAFNLFDIGRGLGMTQAEFSQRFTPAIAVFAMVTASFTNLAITTAMDRDEGILKRIRGTPLPPWVYLCGRIGAAVGIGMVSVLLMLFLGVAFFGLDLVWSQAPVALLVLVVGAATFAALGLAVAGAAPNGQAAPAIANAAILPLAIVSGIFFPAESAPDWVQAVASLFPLLPFVDAFTSQWIPQPGAGLPWADLAVMAGWAVAGVVIALRTFTWEPRERGHRRGQVTDAR